MISTLSQLSTGYIYYYWQRVFEIQKICAEKTVKKKRHYLVQWYEKDLAVGEMWTRFHYCPVDGIHTTEV